MGDRTHPHYHEVLLHLLSVLFKVGRAGYARGHRLAPPSKAGSIKTRTGLGPCVPEGHCGFENLQKALDRSLENAKTSLLYDTEYSVPC